VNRGGEYPQLTRFRVFQANISLTRISIAWQLGVPVHSVPLSERVSMLCRDVIVTDFRGSFMKRPEI